MKRIQFLIFTISLTFIAALGYFAAGFQEVTRECRDPAGLLLYRVRGAEVIGPNNVRLGTVKNGEVRDSANRLLARGGDPGLLYCLPRQ